VASLGLGFVMEVGLNCPKGAIEVVCVVEANELIEGTGNWAASFISSFEWDKCFHQERERQRRSKQKKL
jgi:hypothetical protein